MSAQDAVPPGLKPRILVIDDDPQAAAAAVAILGELGEPVAVSAASYALDRLAGGETFDLLVCEVALRHLTGAEFYRRVRYFHPAAALRTIFVTRALAEDAWASVEMLRRPCVAKPYAKDALL